MSNTKRLFLNKQGLLNPKPQRVADPLFRTLEFFDPLDLPQVRYEMLRAARVDNSTVIEAGRRFGFCRQYFYQCERAFMDRGLVGLLGSPKGRRPLLSLNQEIVNFIVHRKMMEPEVTGEGLRKEILELFNVDASRRTVERTVEKLGLGKRGLRTS